jgi:hypothetical protein
MYDSRDSTSLVLFYSYYDDQVMVANAGIIVAKRLFDVSLADWERVQAVVSPEKYNFRIYALVPTDFGF